MSTGLAGTETTAIGSESTQAGSPGRLFPGSINGAEQGPLTTLREKLAKIGARAVLQGRYVTVQLAEVAIPLLLVTEIRQPIAGPRPWPASIWRFYRTAHRQGP